MRDMTVKEQIDTDLKQAMLAGEKELVTTLRGLKSAILYVEVAEGKREEGLSDDVVIGLLQKEAKKRQESAELYRQGGSLDRQNSELAEKAVIEKYLPKQLTEDEIAILVDQAIAQTKAASIQQMGQVIGIVKQVSGGSADGAVVARLVKEKLSK